MIHTRLTKYHHKIWGMHGIWSSLEWGGEKDGPKTLVPTQGPR